MELAYSGLFLVFSNYSPASHNLNELRGLAEQKLEGQSELCPHDRRRYSAWFNTLNEAYVKARYSHHYSISGEALTWLLARISEVIKLYRRRLQSTSFRAFKRPVNLDILQ
ncbi:HEPN domain-containing protein [Rhizobium mongolense]|uniref:hypothetical protein n=1 Tax=Rhizobium mongolense TaxID=57676 RepID=UPI00389B37A7